MASDSTPSTVKGFVLIIECGSRGVGTGGTMGEWWERWEKNLISLMMYPISPHLKSLNNPWISEDGQY